MTERLALIIAYNILCDELDRAADDLEYSPEYCQEIKEAKEEIYKMILQRY